MNTGSIKRKKRGMGLKVELPKQFKLPESFTSEPLFLLLKSIKLTDPWVIFGIFFLVGLFDDLLLGALTRNWNSRPGIVGVFDLNNIPPLIMSLIVEPGLWAFFVGFPHALYRLFDTFQEKGIFLTEGETVQAQVNWLKKAASSWVLRFTVLPLAILIALYCLLLISGYNPKFWFDLGWHHWLYFARIVATAYVSVYSLAWSLMALTVLYRLFCSTKVKVKPYDGDNAGGLRFVGRFIMDVSRLTLILVPLLIAETLFAVRMGRGILGQFNLWLEIIVLPLFLGVLVFLPLTACRRAMISAKDDFLNQIRDKILKNVELTNQSDEIDPSRIAETVELINYQTRLRKDYPTWPFDVSMTQQVGFSFILSLLPIILGYALSK